MEEKGTEVGKQIRLELEAMTHLAHQERINRLSLIWYGSLIVGLSLTVLSIGIALGILIVNLALRWARWI